MLHGMCVIAVRAAAIALTAGMACTAITVAGTQRTTSMHMRTPQGIMLTGVSCWRCGKRGHLAKDCYQPAAKPCIYCAQYGHEAGACPNRELCSATRCCRAAACLTACEAVNATCACVCACVAQTLVDAPSSRRPVLPVLAAGAQHRHVRVRPRRRAQPAQDVPALRQGGLRGDRPGRLVQVRRQTTAGAAAV